MFSARSLFEFPDTNFILNFPWLYLAGD